MKKLLISAARAVWRQSELAAWHAETDALQKTVTNAHSVTALACRSVAMAICRRDGTREQNTYPPASPQRPRQKTNGPLPRCQQEMGRSPSIEGNALCLTKRKRRVQFCPRERSRRSHPEAEPADGYSAIRRRQSGCDFASGDHAGLQFKSRRLDVRIPVGQQDGHLQLVIPHRRQLQLRLLNGGRMSDHPTALGGTGSARFRPSWGYHRHSCPFSFGRGLARSNVSRECWCRLPSSGREVVA